jgi:undecaprenyl-diphosphatase
MRRLFIMFICSVCLLSFKIDKKYPYDDNKFWGLHYDVPYDMAIIVTSIALIEGTNTRLGRTSFVALDSVVMSTVITTGIKQVAGRVRPRSAKSSDEWFEYGNLSFPSGHVSSVTAFVTPYILEYHKTNPLVWSLVFFPIHQMVGRVKYQAHWTSDVIVGAMVGVLSGYIAHNNSPLLLSLSDDKKFVGIRHRF